MSNQTYRIIIGVLFLLVAGIFVMNGMNIHARSAIHQIYQMLHLISAVLCAGFGFLIIKG